MAREVIVDTCVYFMAGERIVEQRGANADRRGAGDNEFQRVCSGDTPALTDDRNIFRSGNLVYLLYL